MKPYQAYYVKYVAILSVRKYILGFIPNWVEFAYIHFYVSPEAKPTETEVYHRYLKNEGSRREIKYYIKWLLKNRVNVFK